MGYLVDELGLDDETAGEKLARELAEGDYDFIAALRRVRESLGLSQAQLGARMGVTQASVSAFESGDTEARLSTIRRYAHALNAQIEHRVIAGGVDYTRCGHSVTWSGRTVVGAGRVHLGPAVAFIGGPSALVAFNNKQTAFALSA